MSLYLSKYKWKEIKIEVIQNHLEENDHKKGAFKTVCHLANRQMQRHRFQKLFKVVLRTVLQVILTIIGIA